MKTIVFTFIFFLIIGVSNSNAQLIRSYGLKIGAASTNENLNWAQWTGIKSNSNSRQALDAGIFIEWFNLPFLSVITELNYIQKGSNVTMNILAKAMGITFDKVWTFTTKINYLSLPLLAKARFDSGLITPYVIAGPRLDFYLSNSNINYPMTYNKLDIGGTFGIGAELNAVSPIGAGAEIRYSPSFKDCYSQDGLTIRNNSLELLLIVSY